MCPQLHAWRIEVALQVVLFLTGTDRVSSETIAGSVSPGKAFSEKQLIVFLQLQLI